MLPFDHDGHRPTADGATRVHLHTDWPRHSRPPQDGHLVAELHDLQQRLASLPVIEQAKGLVMGYYGIDADAAFNLLRRWSQTTNTKLRTVSSTVVDAATLGPAVPGGRNRGLQSAIRRFEHPVGEAPHRV